MNPNASGAQRPQSPAHLHSDLLAIDRQVLNDFAAASSREWLVTNGIGGYASGSLSGANTRRYHGLLVAALKPPTERRILLSRLEETITVDGETYELAANQYPGAIYPQGFQYLERFEAWPAPTFFYRPPSQMLLEKRIWMARGQNTTFIQYILREAPGPVTLRLMPLLCWKDYHAEMHAWEGFPVSVASQPGETQIVYNYDTPLLRLIAPGTDWEHAEYWHHNVEHLREMERGFDFREDLYCPGHFLATLEPGKSLTITATIDDDPETPEASWRAMQTRQATLLRQTQAKDALTRALALASDAFIVEAPGARRKNAPTPTRSTILAGYHWFTDWGRDTMISLPGLCLTTGRTKVAREILTSYAAFVSEGMLPNRFPDEGEAPEYNTVDATLWYFEAIRDYVQTATDGLKLARELWPTLKDIVDWHIRGTRYGIGVDEVDGLLRAGVPGWPLTWMDARVGDRAITPRIGKPVEVNALWYNALCTMEALASQLGEESREYRRRTEQVKRSFRAAFLRPDRRGLYDVITEEGPDASLRPNQIFAVSLPYSPLVKDDQKMVVRVVEQTLLTPFGLRSLAPEDPAYCPRYGGNSAERDSAYHQGTVWPWLLGPFVLAHYRVYGHREKALGFLRPLETHLREAGVGFISELFDAEPPHAPNGCIAQAWSVAETLRALKNLTSS